ncbi:MAG: Esterase TesA precursor, partial [Planctomycetota bacterium]
MFKWHHDRSSFAAMCLVLMSWSGFATGVALSQTWPLLPEMDGGIEVPAQPWPLRPGPRTVRVLVHYPGGNLASINDHTGLMLTLHNWGGTDCVGTADPRTLARELNVIAICVNYLQSGPRDSIEGPEPYDFGYLQALDALRALYAVQQSLESAQRPYDARRTYATGGSGGGNVALMANKLAPRTFAAIIDLCGMKKLTDDIAFNLPGGSDLNARYVRDPDHPYHLRVDDQELRFVGNPHHLRIMRGLESSTRIVVVHGIDDTTCPYVDAVEMVENMRRVGLDVQPHWIGQEQLDGTVFTSAGHSLGDRTRIVMRYFPGYNPAQAATGNAPPGLLRKGRSDFELREEIVYPTSQGAFVISYRDGAPIGRFEPRPASPRYPDHTDLSYYLDTAAERHSIRNIADWEKRRAHIREGLQQVMGRMPSPLKRVPLNITTIQTEQLESVRRDKIRYQTELNDTVSAYLFRPRTGELQPRPAVLCLHQTTDGGKQEPAGISGDPNLHYALELAKRGYVTLAPDYPTFGDHAYDFARAPDFASGSMKAIWDNQCAVDVLQSLPEVDADRIGCIGHSLGGHNAIFTAVFDDRLKVVVS